MKIKIIKAKEEVKKRKGQEDIQQKESVKL